MMGMNQARPGQAGTGTGTGWGTLFVPQPQEP